MLKQRFALLVALSIPALPAFSADWRPVSPEELALKQSTTDPKADAQGMFKDVRIENDLHGGRQNVMTTYIRIKIFTDRGKERYSERSIEYAGKTHVYDVQGRTIHPDGTIVELKKDAIFDKVEVKKGGYKAKVVKFAMPGVEPGSIIEYKWARNYGDISESFIRYFPLDVQDEFPIDEVSFHLKPVHSDYAAMPRMRFLPFGCEPQKTETDNKGFTTITVRNVPAFKDEPYSPPEHSAKQWILVFYEENEKTGKDKYWTSLGHDYYTYIKDRIRVNGEAKQISAEVTANGKTDEEKLIALADWVRKNVKNIWSDDVTAEERDGFKKNTSSADAIKRQVGTGEDLVFAFIALAEAAGYDARYAAVADRRWYLFDPAVQSGYFLNNFDAAVSVNDKWKFFDLSNDAAPSGTLTWREQGVYALLVNSKDSEFVKTPLLTADQTKRQRVAQLTLSADGTLEGDVRELLFGNEAVEWRLAHKKSNEEERQELVKEDLKERFSDFEVRDIKVTAAPDPKLPVGISYHLTVRNYAQKTGKRIFIKPGFLAAGVQARFTEPTRRNNVYFNYPWSEEDSYEIALPKGFVLDHADAPAPSKFPPVGEYSIKLSIRSDNTLIYKRMLSFGADQIPIFDAKNYPILKTIFDQVHTGDEHMITLKAAEAAPSTGQ